MIRASALPAIRLRLVNRRTLRQQHPRLFIPRPEMCRRVQPGRIIEGAAPDDTGVTRWLRPDLHPAAKAYSALRAHPARLGTTTSGHAARGWLKFLSRQSERFAGDHHAN